jgi:chromosome segregation ATPase
MATTTTELLADHWHEEKANGSSVPELALGPLVEKIAYSLARGLTVAMKELENHIASETRKVSDSVGRRLDALQASVQDLSMAVSEQRVLNLAVQEKCKDLAAVTESLKDSGARQAADLTALRTETSQQSASMSERIQQLCKDVGVQQEDLAAIKSNFEALGSRMDSLTQRLDKQAEALRSMYATYAQRETELEQLVEGLVKLRAYPAPKSANGL